MSALAEKLADEIAAKAIKYIDETGDESLYGELSKSMLAQSQTLQEAFITSYRVQRAALRASEILDKRIASAAKPTPSAPPAGAGD